MARWLRGKQIMEVTLKMNECGVGVAGGRADNLKQIQK